MSRASHVPRFRVPRALAAPSVVFLLVFAAYPLVYLIGLAFTSSTLAQPLRRWTGFDNFHSALESQSFSGSLWRSVVFAVAAACVQLVLGTALALLLRARAARPGLLGTVLLLPLVTPPVMVGVAWKLLLAPVGGALNGALHEFGLPGVNPLGGSTGAFVTLIVIDSWQWTPFVMLLAYAALLGVPDELREAAALDGAGRVRTLRSVVLPYIEPTLLSVLTLKLVIGFKVFDIVYVVTAGGPGFSTTTSTYDIQRTALQEFDVGSAAAATVLFSLIIGLVVSVVALRRKRHEEVAV
ncbi:putative ABC transporter permease protein [Streptomyces himastatinicus ATCC 53653]|uniref:Putative ABC transporter permease protein n=1 Tax=Streptomyces himastatinicus ATCC 53653 TaxID=457427 RepID=D9WSJ1_9ACTN|nr:sugar ABC transporter permease [Streptomyces himastatinicus]EFL22132.1 putative ABC transporter permease protein [Streptomyces himastatinicus ATCC 53653]CCC21131.1 putative transporter permease [Streptomyces himastatinicus ATCC 53653]